MLLANPARLRSAVPPSCPWSRESYREHGRPPSQAVLRAPLIWYGRREHANDPEDQRWRLEHNAYHRVALTAMAVNAVDPHHYHGADLDADSWTGSSTRAGSTGPATS